MHEPTKEDFLKFQGGHKGKVFKGKYVAKPEFPEGRGIQPIKPSLMG